MHPIDSVEKVRRKTGAHEHQREQDDKRDGLEKHHLYAFGVWRWSDIWLPTLICTQASQQFLIRDEMARLRGVVRA